MAQMSKIIFPIFLEMQDKDVGSAWTESALQ